MGDLVDFVKYKRKKEIREEVYGSYEAWVARRFLSGAQYADSRYDLAVEEQQEGEFHLYKYFFPDYDW